MVCQTPALLQKWPVSRPARVGGAGGADVVGSEAHGVLVEAVEARRADRAVAVAAQVAVALVVGEDEDDVGARIHCSLRQASYSARASFR